MNEDLMKSWEGKDPAPIEYMHGRLMEHFHEYRKANSHAGVMVMIDGVDFNKIIAKAKSETYEKYAKLDLKRPIDKSELI